MRAETGEGGRRGGANFTVSKLSLSAASIVQIICQLFGLQEDFLTLFSVIFLRGCSTSKIECTQRNFTENYFLSISILLRREENQTIRFPSPKENSNA